MRSLLATFAAWWKQGPWRGTPPHGALTSSYLTAAESLYGEMGRTAAIITQARNHGIPYATFEQVIREQARAGTIPAKTMQFTLDLARILYGHPGIEATEAMELMKLGWAPLVRHPAEKESDHA